MNQSPPGAARRRLVAPLPVLVLLAGLLAAPGAPGEGLRLTSGEARITLLELYTSEGCSSCPPADAWLSGLRRDSRLWQQVVPIAFHVDYWDYIGWRDRFASPDFSQRQRDYARQGRLSTVYTPGFVQGGEEWRGWFRSRHLDLSPDPVPAGRLEIDYEAPAARARYQPSTRLDRAPVLHVALLGFGLESPVRAGENRGGTLRHDFVVLAHAQSAMLGADGVFEGAARLPAPSARAPRHALAAWVSLPDDQRPLQAAGGWLP